MRFKTVAVAGTFDHLHSGHIKLLQTALNAGKKIWVGLCTRKMLTVKLCPESIESYSTRLKSVKQFKPNKIIPLTDIYGPAISSPNIDALVCTTLTRQNADKINQKRRLNNLNYLSIIDVPLVLAQDQKPISSTRIRQGRIDRQGLVYPNLFLKTLVLPNANRQYFQKPIGLIVKTPSQPLKNKIITVGDIATLSFLNNRLKPDLAIVDLKSKRQPIYSNLSQLGLNPGLMVANPPATITPLLAKKIIDCLDKKIPTLLIQGEEDLAVLPAILLAPLKTIIYYGQPNLGLVKIVVTETVKTKTVKFLTYLSG